MSCAQFDTLKAFYPAAQCVIEGGLEIAESKKLTWQAHTLCGETWWACSWQGVKASLPWVQILANHLLAFL